MTLFAAFLTWFTAILGLDPTPCANDVAADEVVEVQPLTIWSAADRSGLYNGY